jgi:ubiquinone/menaquinone biosynthesis C-methylase UbiE
MCTSCFSTATEQLRSDAFGGQLLQTLNHAGLSLMFSIGHRTGLFDIMHTMDPATSHEIASEAALHERYVREWLGAMVVGKVVMYEPVTQTYYLPPAHARWLTRGSGPENMAALTQYIGVLASVEDEVVQAFKNGGGVSYDRYSRFHEVMAEDSGSVAAAYLLQTILPLCPEVLQKMEKGARVAEIGCGEGNHLLIMAENFPDSQFVGYDFCEQPIAKARAKAAFRGLRNITFVQQDVTHLALSDAQDVIFAFDAIHDQAHPEAVLKKVAQQLKKEGIFFMVDIDASSHLEENLEHPLGPLFYALSTMHCMTVSLAAEGSGLGTVWGTQLAQSMLREAGFSQIELHRIKGDIQNCYYVARR